MTSGKDDVLFQHEFAKQASTQPESSSWTNALSI